jgi:hypothetical protein
MIKIIMYVRHPVNLAESLVPTLLWYGGFPRVEIDQILLLKFQNYFKSRIQKIENVFGNDNLIITSYEAAQNHPNRIVGHFLDQINVAYQPFDAASFAFNSRPSQISCEIINRYNLNLAQSTNLDTADNIHKLYQLEGDVFKLPDAQRKNIYEINKSDSHWLYEYTQIDYRDFPTQTSQMQSAHDSQNKMSLFSLFNVLTPTLQRATIDYLNEHQHDLFDDDQITFLTQSHTAKRRFINNPKINPRISIESMYISCAAVLAAHNDFDMALRLLNYAQIYNQESDHIKQKIEEYTLYVSKPD